LKIVTILTIVAIGTIVAIVTILTRNDVQVRPVASNIVNGVKTPKEISSRKPI
jgi:hypothetical protein